ncbi:hypothetical protein SprV_0301145500 [Sparganum proliferum]
MHPSTGIAGNAGRLTLNSKEVRVKPLISGRKRNPEGLVSLRKRYAAVDGVRAGDGVRAAKLRSLSHSSPEENEILVHNMSSKQLTPAQMKVLSQEACFNTTDADPVNLVATVESILKQTGESDETAHLIRQQVTSLVMAHKPRAIITRAEQSALRALRTDTSIVILAGRQSTFDSRAG